MTNPREFWLAEINGYEPFIFDEETVRKFKSDFNKNNTYVHVREVLPNEPDWKALCEKLGEALNKIPSSQEMEKLARNWYSFDKENRTAQHFYEGMLHMRSYILKALAEYREAVK